MRKVIAGLGALFSGEMDVFAIRTLQYRYDTGERDVVLTVFMPHPREEGDWKCEYRYSPPEGRRNYYVYGVDFIQALVDGLRIARAYIEHPTEERSSWQGMFHSGLPWHTKDLSAYHPLDIPPPENDPGTLEPIATRRIPLQDGDGARREAVLTLYKPFQAADRMWKCGFSFTPTDGPSIRYGVGEDSIEAFLDALALARAVFETKELKDWSPAEELDCSDLPFKIGRQFWIGPYGERLPDGSDAMFG